MTMAMAGMNFECFGDIFSYLTDELVNSEAPSVEATIDSLYNYGLIHGDNIQSKLEKSPFYTKQYKKLTAKQQQLLRAERVRQEEVVEDSEESEEEPVKVASVKKGKSKGSAKEAPHPPILLNSGRTFIGVSYSTSLVRRTEDKHSKGGRGHSKAVSDTNSQNPYEAVVNISNRKISIGFFPTVETAAQAHDRALIRANGPTAYKQSGVLNYPLSFYASDSLSKFYAFDTILRKQLFGADWSGLKPCDFGFLMTQMPSLPAKRGADFNAMDGSRRKKRHKGQYSDGDNDASGSDFESVDLTQASGAYKKKKLLYGNYYASVGGREDAEAEEPYFKSPTSPAVSGKRIASFNKKVPKMPAMELSTVAQPGDIVVVMHGLKERTQGRTAYERCVILERLVFGGWLVFGLSDRTSRNMRGEQVSLMASCDAHMKYMRVPPEAWTAEDSALHKHFSQMGLIKGQRAAPAAPAYCRSSAASISDGYHSSAISSSESAAVLQTKPINPPQPIRRFAERSVQLASLWYQSNSQRAIIPASEIPGYEPESLYNLADYPCLGSAAYKAMNSAMEREALTDPARRGSRSTGVGAGGNSSLPPNFQTFSSSMFALKLNDLSASACYMMPQELLLYRVLLGLADKHANSISGRAEGSATSSGEDRNSAPISAPIVSTLQNAPPAPELPVLPWHRSLLEPASLETLAALSAMRQQIQEVLVAAMSNGVDVLNLIEKAPESFYGVSVTNLAKPGVAANAPAESKRDVRYTFELSTESRKLITDLGISQAIVNGSTILANTSNLGSSQTAVESGSILVGYFSSALEAALVREQVLGLTRSSFGISCSYGGRTGERNMVVEKPNFTSADWAELKKLAKLLTRFTRKFVLA